MKACARVRYIGACVYVLVAKQQPPVSKQERVNAR